VLFAGGVTVGLVVPWGFGPSKPGRSDEAGERTVNVRCIVEYRNGQQVGPNGQPRRMLPRPDDDGPPNPATATPVEVVVQPGTKGRAGADDLTVILRLPPCCGAPEAAPPPRERPMPGAM